MNPLVVVRHISVQGKRRGAQAYFWCPGCDDLHGVGVLGDDGSQPEMEWTWDRDLVKPTVQPSILVGGVQWDENSGFHKPKHRVAAGQPTVCHSYVVDGRWQFLGDCTHELAGQTVDMVPLPDYMCHK